MASIGPINFPLFHEAALCGKTDLLLLCIRPLGMRTEFYVGRLISPHHSIFIHSPRIKRGRRIWRSFGRRDTRVAARWPGQPKVFTQRAAFILGAEQAATP